MLKIASVLLLLLFPVSSLALEQVSITTTGDVSSNSSLVFTAPFKSNTVIELDLGHSLSAGTLELKSKNLKTFRVNFQLESSMSINDEGPHLDLTDWKHCTTEWQSLTRLSPLKFKLPDFDAIDMSCFPKVSMNEIKSAVLKSGGHRWADVIKNDSSISDSFAILISLSTVRIKIEELVDDDWKVITILNFTIPMGC